MPVNFSPKPIVRFEETLLNYMNINFQRVQDAFKRAQQGTVSTTAPPSPQTGDTYYNSTSQTSFRYNGTAWVEEVFMGNRDSLVTSPGATAPNVTLALMPWNTAGLDTALMTYSAGTFTVVKSGYYVISACIVYGTGGTGTRNCYVMHNGAYVARQGAPPDAVSPGSTCSYGQYLTAGDTVSAWYYQNSGGNLALVGGASASYFGFVRTGG